MLDIIIPQYKEDESVIKNLLDSIKNQKGINFDEIRITIVNDCSGVDLSVSFLESYEPLRIRYLINEKNTGPGLARQYGINRTGEPYIMFIDADDELSNEFALKVILDFIKFREPDYLVTNIKVEVIKDGKLDTIIKKNRDTFPWMHGKVYKREFLYRNHIKFHENIRHTEDSYFTTSVLGVIDQSQICFIDHDTVLWKMNNNSLTRTLEPSDYTYKIFDDFFNTPFYSFEYLSLHKSPMRFSYYVEAMFGLYIVLNSNVFNKDGRLEQKNDYEKILKNNIMKRRNLFILFKENELRELYNNELKELVDRMLLKDITVSFDSFVNEYLKGGK